MAAFTFAGRLKELREEQGWTQGELARAAGLTLSAVAKYEQGLREPTWAAVQQLARALGVELQAFVVADQPQAQDPPAAKGNQRSRK